MLEIVFDENKGDGFLGQKFPEICVRLPADGSPLGAYRKTAAEIVRRHQDSRAVILKSIPEGRGMNMLALALAVETYEEKGLLESAVFRVAHSGKALCEYKPYAALANSIRYVRDLMRLDEDEMFADIKRLGYLGLKINEDYIEHRVNILWPGSGTPVKFEAKTKTEALIAVGVTKAWAICKAAFAAEAVIFKEKIDDCSCDEDKIIDEIAAKARI